MIDRLMTCLFHPKFIARFINDSIWKIIGILFLLFVVASIPLCLRIVNDNSISTDFERLIIQNVSLEDTSDLAYTNGEWVGNDSFICQIDNLYILINQETLPSVATTDIIFSYGRETVSIIYGGFKVLTLKYNESSTAFTLASVQSGNIKSADAFLSLIENTYENFSLLFVPFNIIIQVGYMLVMFVLILFITYLFSYGNNPFITGAFRFKIVLYSMVSYLTVVIFANVFNLTWLSYIAIVFPYIYSGLALRSIQRIEIRKK